MSAIQALKLTKYYGAAKGIEDLDLEIRRGEFFGFIGPNGAGKSTTIRTLLGLISPTSGSAQVLGLDIVKDKNEILQSVGYLPSEAVFYSGMRVKDVLKLSAELRKKDCREEAKLLCDRLQLDTSRKVEDLSFGNRKKVAIVCALQHKPKLYILDEPTSGLDPLMQQEFFSILKERNREGATIFLSSHVLSEIKKYCSKAAIIREGRILLCDSVDNLGHTGVKKVSIKGVEELPSLQGISDVKSDDERISFLYSGEVTALLSALSTVELTDININDPELDEIFMSYYAKEDK